MKYLVQLKDYLREAIHETKKVTWPTKKTTVNYSIIVIALSVAVAVFFAVLDYFFSLGLAQII